MYFFRRQLPTSKPFVQMATSLIQPSSRSKSSQKSSARRTENNRIYAHPLPIILSEPSQPSFLRKTLSLFGVSVPDILNPHCQGVLDIATHSVWVPDTKDAMVLWQRGFFGKGDLSRSEPSWLARQRNAQQLAKKGAPPSRARRRWRLTRPRHGDVRGGHRAAQGGAKAVQA